MTVSIQDACPEGAHFIERHPEDLGVKICRRCGIRTQTLVTWHEHDLRLEPEYVPNMTDAYHNELTNTALVNIKDTDGQILNQDGAVYIGRRNRQYNVDRSVFANEYTVDEHGRLESVLRYTEDMYDRLRGNETFRSAIRTLEGHTLVCWCYPKLCHGHALILHLVWKNRLNISKKHPGSDYDVAEERVKETIKQIAEDRT